MYDARVACNQNFKIMHVLVVAWSIHPSKWYQSLLSHDLHAKILIFASVVNIDYIVNYNFLWFNMLLVASVVTYKA